MAKHTLKILRCEHGKIFKDVWPFYNIMDERVKEQESSKLIIILTSVEHFEEWLTFLTVEGMIKIS